MGISRGSTPSTPGRKPRRLVTKFAPPAQGLPPGDQEYHSGRSHFEKLKTWIDRVYLDGARVPRRGRSNNLSLSRFFVDSTNRVVFIVLRSAAMSRRGSVRGRRRGGFVANDK